MDKSQILVDYLIKYCGVLDTVLPVGNAFDFYKSNVNKLPQSAITESFLKIEDSFLRNILKTKEIYDTDKAECYLKIIKKEAAFFKADAVLSFASGGQDKSVYLYGGTRLKTQVANALSKDKMAVTKGEPLFYKGIVSSVIAPITKITSVVLGDINDKYKYILDMAHNLRLSTLVLTVPNVDNALFENRVAESIIGVIKSHKVYGKVKIVLSVNNEQTFTIFNKILQGGNI